MALRPQAITGEGAGEHDGLLIAVALAWRLGFNVKRARHDVSKVQANT